MFKTHLECLGTREIYRWALGFLYGPEWTFLQGHYMKHWNLMEFGGYPQHVGPIPFYILRGWTTDFHGFSTLPVVAGGSSVPLVLSEALLLMSTSWTWVYLHIYLQFVCIYIYTEYKYMYTHYIWYISPAGTTCLSLPRLALQDSTLRQSTVTTTDYTETGETEHPMEVSQGMAISM